MPPSLLERSDLTVLLVGSGGREHAFATRLVESPRLDTLFVAPGNAGTAEIATNVPIDAEDVDALVMYSVESGVDFVVVGPEGPLAAGLVDRLDAAGILVFGPTAAAARIESSKWFAKELMREHGVPTASTRKFTDFQTARDYILDQEPPIVVAADGLAAGKGVVVALDHDEALAALRERLGDGGPGVLVQEYMSGQEISVFAFIDGERVSSMIAACDYSPVGDGNVGPNTGGMGSYSPPEAAVWNPEMESRVRREIIEPVVAALALQGSPFRGILYAGLMLTVDGPKVVEFNCRLGDPEAQVVLPRLKSDLLDILIYVAQGDVSAASLEWDDQSHVAVVLASGGYPGKYATGFPIDGLDEMPPGVMVYHAGTRLGGDTVTTAGGRVLAASASGDTLEVARLRAYEGVSRIRFSGSFHRGDIALIQ
ncbi:MAG: phosphoribosylamine--glycine ligase [SAR202 cluster bacterium]|nr:phosphoribosylamine--glycine ligase [SAR202 cluster bacterium]